MSFDPDLLTNLGGFGKVLNQPAAGSQWVQCFGRDRELDFLLRRLGQPACRSFVLVGPSGCGKSALIRELVRRGDAELPEPWAVLETSASMLLAGTHYLGDLETRVKKLIDLAKRPNRVLLYFTDVFALVEAGRSAHSDISIGSFLTPYAESGDLVLVGESTPEQYRLGFDRHPTFKKLFDAVRIEEQPVESAAAVLRSVADRESARLWDRCGARLIVPDNVLERIVELSDAYFHGQAFPGKAVRLFDHVLDQEVGDEADLPPAEDVVLAPAAVVRALHRYTGIPTALVDDTQTLDLDDVRKFFEDRVLGQADAVDAMVDLITLIKAGVTDPNKPLGVFFFVGPTGVGKTEMAKALAEFIFGGSERMLRFDMSEYKDYNSFEKLIGNPQAKEGSAMQAGNLLASVRQEPFAVILLDEIEKAHPNIFDIFLQVFDDGRLTDPLGQTTNFTQTIAVMTSNVGSDLRREGFGFKPDEQGSLRDDIEQAMQRCFRPEFLNRIGRIVFFQPLQREHMRAIAERELRSVLARSGIVRRNLRVDVDPGVIDILLREGFSRTYGARPLKRCVERLALLPVARQMIKLRKTQGEPLLRLLAVGDRIKVTIVQAEESRPIETTAKSVRVVDPVRKKKVRLTPPRIAGQAEALKLEVDRLEATCAADRLEERKAALLELTTAAGFWDDPPRARGVLGEIHRLECLLEAVARVRKRSDDLLRLVADAHSGRNPQALAAAADRLQDVRRHIDLVDYTLQCQGAFERCDAFVRLSLIDDEPPEDDLAGLLADMYANWARTKGFEVSIVHEDLLDDGATRELVLLVEGGSVYGILRGEEGVHEMIYGRTSKAPKQSRFVKVRVLPLVEEETPALPPDDVSVKRAAAKGEGRRVKRYRSRVSLTHLPSLITVEAKSGLPPDEAVTALGDLLRAEHCRRHNALAAAERNGADGELEQVIRKYTLRPSQQVKDQRTGLVRSGLDDLWNGALDEFLHAHLAMRRQAEAGSAGTPGENVRP